MDKEYTLFLYEPCEGYYIATTGTKEKIKEYIKKEKVYRDDCYICTAAEDEESFFE